MSKMSQNGMFRSGITNVCQIYRNGSVYFESDLLKSNCLKINC